MSRRNHGSGSEEAMKCFYRLADMHLDPNGFEYFDLLPVEIQLIIMGYISFYARITGPSLVSNYWRGLVIQCPVDKILLDNFYCDGSAVNASWIGQHCQVSRLILPSSISNKNALRIVKLTKSVKTVVDLHNQLIDGDEPRKYRVAKSSALINVQKVGASLKAISETAAKSRGKVSKLPRNTQQSCSHVFNYMCDSDSSLHHLARIFPALESLRVKIWQNQQTKEVKFYNLRRIFINSFGYNCDAIKEVILSCRQIAPNLEEVFLPVKRRYYMPQETTELHLYASQIGVHLVVDLLDILGDTDNFVAQFKANNKPYSFYRYGKSSLFGRAVVQRHLNTAKYLLDNGYTTLEAELGSYSFPKEFGECFNVCTERTEINAHPFILDENFSNEEFMTYIIAKGLDVNSRVNGRSFFECYSSLKNDVIKFILSNCEVDFSVNIRDGKTLFHLMAEDAAEDLFRIAIQRFVDLDDFRDLLHTKNDNGTMPVHIIFSKPEAFWMLDLLLPLNIDLQTKNQDDENVYSLVLKKQNPEEPIKQFIEADYYIDDSWIAVLFEKAENSQRFINDLELLARKGVDLSEKFEEEFISRLTLVTPQVLTALQQYGCNIYATFNGNQTLLFSAVLSKNRDTSRALKKILKNFKYDVNHTDDGGFTPLLRALADQNSSVSLTQMIASLLSAGANPNLAGPGVDHALRMAKGRSELVDLLVKYKANINLKKEDFEHAVMTTPLMDLISSQSGYEWKEITTLGAKLDDQDYHKNTLLHFAHSDYFSELIINTKNVDVQNIHGETALFTRHKPSADDLKILLERISDVSHVSKAGLTTLHNALLAGNPRLVKTLLQEHADKLDLSALDNMGRSVGHLITGDVCFKYLYNAVLTKSMAKRKKTIEAFNSVDCFGKTAIHYAIKSLSFAIFAEFVNKFRLNVNPETNVSPLSAAISEIPKISSDYARLLIELGASVNVKDSDGNTPLHLLCGAYPIADMLISFLLKKGASITAKNNRGYAPIDMLPTIEAYCKLLYAIPNADNQLLQVKPKFYPPSVRNSSACTPSAYDKET